MPLRLDRRLGQLVVRLGRKTLGWLLDWSLNWFLELLGPGKPGVHLRRLRLGEPLVDPHLGLGKAQVNCRGRRLGLGQLKLPGGLVVRFSGYGRLRLRKVETLGRRVIGWRGRRRHGRRYRRHNIKALGRGLSRQGRRSRGGRHLETLGSVPGRQSKALGRLAVRGRFGPGIPVDRQSKALGGLVLVKVNHGDRGGGRSGPVLGGLGPDLLHDAGPARAETALWSFQHLLQVLPDPVDYDWILQYLCFFFVPVVRSVKSVFLCQKFALY